jgi:RND superfamily putative drug exporter
VTGLLRRLGGACADHPLRVVAAWLAVVATAVSLSVLVGGKYGDTPWLPGTEVADADAQLAAHFPAASNTSADVLLYDLTPSRVAAAVPVVERRIAQLPHVVVPPTWPVHWSADRHTAVIHVGYDVPRFTLSAVSLGGLRLAAAAGGVESHVTGALANDLYSAGSTSTGEKVSVAVALLVLLLAFGSVIAALMPVASAALAIITGLSLVRLLANVYAVNNSAPEMATMLGLGVGIDYALFIVSRHREGLRSGLTPRESAAEATAAAGTSVLWAGITVVAAICGLAFAGIPLITSLGFSAAIVVAMSVLAALTILPALLALTGERIDKLHIGLPHLRRPGAVVSRWVAWARAIERRPVRYVVAPTLLLIVLAIPLLGIRLGMPDGGSAAPNTEIHRGYALTARAFGVGANSPFLLVVGLPSGADDRSIQASYRRALLADPEVASADRMTVGPDGTTGVLTFFARSSAQSAASMELVPRLRDHVLPAVARTTGTTTLLTGQVPGRYDVAQRVRDRLPWFIAAVLTVSFLLLMMVFRSVLVPLKAVVLNLLSIAAALGVVIAIFQWGWLRQLVGIHETVPVVSVIPMMLFAVVFGLSMDYEVFLLSRVRELWHAGGATRGSVVGGLASTAQVITAAAAIMIAVFLSFTMSDDVIVKMTGVGLAVAVFLDATVIRLVLVPATMALLGDLNWWVPRWLDRLLPHVDVDAAVPVTPYAEDRDVDLDNHKGRHPDYRAAGHPAGSR